MRAKIFITWLWLFAWVGFSCGQGSVSSWENPKDGQEQTVDASDDAGTNGDDQDQDNNPPDADTLADGDGGSSDIGADRADDDGGLSDAGAGDEDIPLCLSGELPALGGLSPEELFLALDDKDFLLINVASASGGQIAGTDAYVPYNDADALVEYIGPDLQERVVLYCVSSGRSGVAGKSLAERGYCSIRHLLGGMNAWTAAGFPLE